jgi:hypothetical protein
MFVGHIVLVARALWRVLRDDATWWLNFGDSYNNRSISRPSSHQAGLGFESEHLSTTWADLTKQGNTRGSLKGGLKEKDLIGIPWRVAFALQADGWYLRSDIIWAKGVSFCPTYSGSCMPESVTDRPTKGHEYVFLLSKNKRYFYDGDAVRENFADERMGNPGKYARTTSASKGANNDRQDLGFLNNGGGWEKGKENGGRNLRTVWTVNPGSYPKAHFATFPPDLVEPMIKAGTSAKGCCPECGAPWERVTEKEQTGRGETSSQLEDGLHTRSTAKSLAQKRQAYRAMGMENPPGAITTGWTPSCSCDAGEPVPCTVLDPFLGSGTTAEVADYLGRHSVGIELSQEYCDSHIIPRLREPLFEWARQEEQEPEPVIEQLEMQL